MQIRKTELLIATALYSFIVYMNVLSTYKPNAIYINYRLLPQFSVIAIVFASYFAINHFILPRYLPKQEWLRIVLASSLTVLAITGVFTLSHHFFYFDTRPSYQESFLNILPSVGWTVSLLATYEILKNLVIYLQEQKTPRHRLLGQILVAGSVWAMISLFFIITDNYHFGALWISLMPFAYIVYQFNLKWLLPKINRNQLKKNIYTLNGLLTIALVWLVFFIVWTLMPPSVLVGTYLGLSILFLLIALLLSSFFYKQNQDREQFSILKRELGKSSADLSSLRSQINPHFLFNILNALYGTALEEKGARTSEGIQKLGDMMRFMLFENTLDFIPLEREISNLRDYIHLQKLRLAGLPEINIEVTYPQGQMQEKIAPMLLIPFVENAFKYGISLKNRSWIHISVAYTHGALNFDIYNSTHHQNLHDPEKNSSGIGLENVRRRLEMIYPDQYTLSISQSPIEYFVHMTLKLER
ncbi:sensor histidine kinase [Dyadobacter luticola]|uniref:Signal transduction histidine kinase internal region domain-containing protein n=1 Tax=Dyadobacter luticola TaxID=1979387 RepID=A0A5R9KLZ5_9BACT|nr:histidine kinase [Dyadobacter luticola]TLU97262.1 hypothetical protein FEN17_26715 [Dyadobacter luticola]